MPDTVREWELSESSLILSKVLTQRLYSLMHSTRDLTEGHFRDDLATLLDEICNRRIPIQLEFLSSPAPITERACAQPQLSRKETLIV